MDSSKPFCQQRQNQQYQQHQQHQQQPARATGQSPKTRRIFIHPSVIPQAFFCCRCGTCTPVPTTIPGIHARDCANPACCHTPLFCSACTRVNGGGIELLPSSLALPPAIASNSRDCANTISMLRLMGSFNPDNGTLDNSNNNNIHNNTCGIRTNNPHFLSSLPENTPVTWMCGWCGNTALPVRDILVDEQPQCCEAPILRAVFDKMGNVVWQARDASGMMDVRKDAELRTVQEFLWAKGCGPYLEEVERVMWEEEALAWGSTPARDGSGLLNEGGPEVTDLASAVASAPTDLCHVMPPYIPEIGSEAGTISAPAISDLAFSFPSPLSWSVALATLPPTLVSAIVQPLSAPQHLEPPQKGLSSNADASLQLTEKEGVAVKEKKKKKKKKKRASQAGTGEQWTKKTESIPSVHVSKAGESIDEAGETVEERILRLHGAGLV